MGQVIFDFLRVFEVHLEEIGDTLYKTKKFYYVSEWNPTLVHKLEREHTYHNNLLIDLLFEMTRIGNLIISLVRKHISYFYRIEEGVLFVQIGNFLSGYSLKRVDYMNPEQYYKNLESFISERASRDYSYESKSFDEYKSKYIKSSW